MVTLRYLLLMSLMGLVVVTLSCLTLAGLMGLVVVTLSCLTLAGFPSQKLTQPVLCLK